MLQGMNPQLVKQAMKKMGIKEEEIDATEVHIKTKNKTIVIHNPHVAKMIMMGGESFQISGDIEERPSHEEEDITTVMQQAACSREEAETALKNAEGDLAKAILSFQS